MEHKQQTSKAKEISAYVKAIYGEQSLGLVRLLSSVPYFRQSVSRGKLPELLGMSLISFEKYLREQHNIIYKYNGTTFSVERLDGGRATVLKTYDDDAVFSVGGAVVAAIRNMYPDLDALSGVPLVSLGIGRSVNNVLDNVDISSICEYISQLPPQYIDDDIVTAVNDYGALLSEGSEITAVSKYLVLDALHRLYVVLRTDPITVKVTRELPSCEPQDFMAVVMGLKRASVVPTGSGKIPSTLLTALKETYPDGEVRDGAFYLTGEVELDPFAFLQHKIVDLSLPDFGAPVCLPAYQDLPSVPTTSSAVPSVSRVGPGFDGAVNLVLQYVDQDINQLVPAEREIALFGFTGGEAAFRKISAAASKNLAKQLSVGPHEPIEVIYKLSSALRAALRTRVRNITDEQFALMAAGRVIAWKGNWVIDCSGPWDKIR